MSTVGRKRGQAGQWIYPASLPDGRTVLLFKVLLSNDCRNDCVYCATRCSSNHERATFEAEELTRLFLELHNRGIAEGMFLSSGVWRSPDETMDRMLTVAEMLRVRHRFNGFLHLKVIPGASPDRVEQAARLADRISINLEAPNARALEQLAPNKDFRTDLIQRMHWISRLVAREDTRARGHTTQFVIGAADETDHEVLHATVRLYERLGLQRAYFSAFQPTRGPRVLDKPATPPMREHRLYQCDYLYRRYGFAFDDFVFGDDGCLPLHEDPKQLWAEAHPEGFPIEVNSAPRADLLRVPGIGPKSVGRIVRRRGREPFHSLDDLRSTGCVATRAAPYVTVNGKLGARRPAQQLVLWAP